MAENTTTLGSGSSQTGSSLGTAAQTAKSKVADTANTVKDKASEWGQQAADKVDSSRGTAADTIENAASTFHQKADSLPGGETVKNVAHTAADKLQSTAGYLREHDTKAMLADVEDLVKRNPGPSLLVAVGLGFLIGRAFRED